MNTTKIAKIVTTRIVGDLAGSEEPSSADEQTHRFADVNFNHEVNRLLVQAGATAAEAVPTLIRMVDDPNEDVRTYVAWILATINDPAAIIQDLIKQPELARSVVGALFEVGATALALRVSFRFPRGQK